MKITNILLKGGQKHVSYLLDGAKEAKVKAFPAATSRKEIDETIKKLESKPESQSAAAAKKPQADNH